MNDSVDLNSVKEGLNALVDAVKQIQDNPIPEYKPANRSISGNAINGGLISNFRSVGIQDLASKLAVTVDDDGLHVKALHTDALEGDTVVRGDLSVNGHISAKSLHVDEVTSDIRQERSSSLEFVADQTESVYGKGLLWKGHQGATHFALQTNPDRLFSTASIDVVSTESYMIGSVPVLSENILGSTIIHSNLQRLGALESLSVQGHVRIDDFIIYNPESQRLGLNTDEPNATFSIASFDHEFIVETDSAALRVGNYNSNDLELVTDNTPRITVTAGGDIKLGIQGNTNTKVTVYGKLGVNVTNVSDSESFAVNGNISHDGKKFLVAAEAPRTGSFNKGDIAWNTNPTPTGFVGWICIREGNPGIWKPFGQIFS